MFIVDAGSLGVLEDFIHLSTTCQPGRVCVWYPVYPPSTTYNLAITVAHTKGGGERLRVLSVVVSLALVNFIFTTFICVHNVRFTGRFYISNGVTFSIG